MSDTFDSVFLSDDSALRHNSFLLDERKTRDELLTFIKVTQRNTCHLVRHRRCLVVTTAV